MQTMVACETMDAPMCSICQMQLVETDEDGVELQCSSLLCGHTFHHVCLDNYVRATHTDVASLACPLCKRKASSFNAVSDDTILLSDVDDEVSLAGEASTTDGEAGGGGAHYDSAAEGRVHLPGELVVTSPRGASAAAGGLGLPAELDLIDTSEASAAASVAAGGLAPAPAVHPEATTVEGTPTPKAKAAPKAKAPAPKMAARFCAYCPL